MLGAAGLVVLALVVGAVFVAFNGGGGPDRRAASARAEASRSAAAVADEFASAATVLAEAPAARYKGTLLGARGTRIPVEVGITNEGVSDATLTVGAETVQVVTAGGGDEGRSAYVKASEAFWRSRGAPADALTDYAGQWVKSDPDVVGVDLSVLAPGALARLLDPGDGVVAPEVGAPVTVNGAEARPMRVGDLVAWVTTASPRRVVRVTAGAASSPAPGASLRTSRLTGGAGFTAVRAPAGTGFAVDVTELTEPETDDFYKVLEERLRGLANALDAKVRFSLTGDISLAPCSTNGCRANVTVNNRVDTGSAYLKAQRPVNATVTIAMTLDGRPVKTCVNAISMPANGSGSTTCWAAYSIPPVRNPTTHEVRATARTVARALVQADVDKLVADLRQERDRNRPVPRPPQNRPTPSAGASPSASRTAAPAVSTPPVVPSPSDPAKDCKVPFYDQQGDKHTRDGHFRGGVNYDPRFKSRWDDAVDLQDMVQLAGYFKPARQANGRCVWNGRAPADIGILAGAGTRTSEFSVITLTNGKLWTMYPGPP